MIVDVLMIAHHNNVVRKVYIPDDQLPENPDQEILLDWTYYYGQNDFCQGPDKDTIRTTICSVSEGDIIHLPDGTYHLVRPRSGFTPMSPEEVEEYKNSDNDTQFTIVYEGEDKS